MRVVAEGGGRQQSRAAAPSGTSTRSRRSASRMSPVGIVARAGDVVALAAGVDLAHGHLVLRERAGLVGADDGGGAERLDRGELADDGAALGHPLHAEREGDGGDRGQPLGDRGDGEAHRLEQELVPAAVALARTRARRARAESARQPERIALAERVEPLLERRLAVARPVDERATASRARCARPSATTTARPLPRTMRRADEEHRRAVAERRVVGDAGAARPSATGTLSPVSALSSAGEVRSSARGARRRGPRRPPRARGCRRPRGPRRGDDGHLVVAPHARVRRLHLLERVERGLGAPLLVEAEDAR